MRLLLVSGRGIVVALSVAAGASCVVFTGGTSGYSAEETDAAPHFDLGCQKTSDCDAGSVCCLSATSSTSGSSACTPYACVYPKAQICRVSSECTGEQECIQQTCLGVSVPLCGLQPICNRDVADAGGSADATADTSVVGIDATPDTSVVGIDASADSGVALDAATGDSAP